MKLFRWNFEKNRTREERFFILFLARLELLYALYTCRTQTHIHIHTQNTQGKNERKEKTINTHIRDVQFK